MERTYRWAQRCVAEHKRLTEERVGKPYQALYGVVQGANYEDLRRHAAEQIASLDFDGVGIGGAIEKRIIGDTCAWICDAMPESRPRHVLGIAAVDDIFACVENGGDTFDCVAPARCGRNGAIFTRDGRYNIKRAQFKHDFGPLEEGCDCYTCTHYSRAYVDHALRAREFNGFTLATIHNEHFFVKLLDDIRASIDDGYFDEFRDETLPASTPTDHAANAFHLGFPPKRTLIHTSAFQGADGRTRRSLFFMCSAHVMHTPIRLTPSTTQCVRFSRIRHLMPIPPLRLSDSGESDNHHVSCPTCPIRAKRTTTMLISRSTCPILEKRTSKQPKNTRWMSETPESDAQSVAPLEFSYGKWREQGWLRRTEAHRASSLLASHRLYFPTENGGATRRFEVAWVLV